MYKNKINILLILVGLIFVPSVFSEQALGTFEQNECMNLIEVCDNCTFLYFNSILYPNGDLENINLVGEQHGIVFNSTFCNTSQTGTYVVNAVGDLDGLNTTGVYSFDITQSGLNFNNMLNEVILFSIVFIFLYLILVWAYNHVEKDVVMIVSFGILLMGVYIMIYGIASLKNDYTLAFSIINIGIGALFLIGLAIEKIREEFN